MTFLSVIIPIYNGATYLEECLKSITNQTLHNIEIICVNDGSSDNSPGILADLASKDRRIKIISRENRGVSASRNEAMLKAKGKYIAFMDSDDLYPEQDILETLYTKAEENQVQICGGEFSEFSEENRKLKKDFSHDVNGFIFEREGNIKYTDYQFDYGFYRFIYNRKMLLENNIIFPPYQRFEDPPFFVRAMLQAGQFYAVKKTVYAYRTQHKTVNWNQKATADFCKGINDVYLYAKQHKLNKLLIYCYHRICGHWPQIRHTLSAADLSLLTTIEANYLAARQNIGRWLFSNKKSITGIQRYITVLGFKFTRKTPNP